MNIMYSSRLNKELPIDPESEKLDINVFLKLQSQNVIDLKTIQKILQERKLRI